jgi:hypothetical protein
MREASEAGCTVTSAAEGEIDITTPEGWFRCGIAFLMAEWASRSQSWKVTQAMERRSNDKRKRCRSCGVVHLGRHPDTCRCRACLKKKGRSEIPVGERRKAQGLPRVSLKALGNAVVPQCAQVLGYAILEIEKARMKAGV